MIVVNTEGYLVRLNDDGVEPVLASGTPVRPGYSYCKVCGHESPQLEVVIDHYLLEHKGRDNH